MDLDQLVRACYESPIFRSAVDLFADRTRNASITTVEQLEKWLKADGASVTRPQVIEVLRTLEACGCGQFRIGRRGHPSRFTWSVPNAELAKRLRGQSQPPVSPAGTPPPGLRAHQPDVRRKIEHIYHLRTDYEVKLELPADLSAAEAEKLSLFVRSLPFV